MKTEIENYNACEEAVTFRKKFKTFNEAWEKCERGDWMLWISKKVDVDLRKLHLAKGRCAELVIHLMDDQRSKDAVKAAIDYGNGEISESELSAYAAYAAYAAAADAADAAADAAGADSYAAAAAAADAADAAAAAADAADAAAYAAYAAYAAAADAAVVYAADAARKDILKKCADICREVLTEEVLNKLGNKTKPE